MGLLAVAVVRYGMIGGMSFLGTMGTKACGWFKRMGADVVAVAPAWVTRTSEAVEVAFRRPVFILAAVQDRSTEAAELHLSIIEMELCINYATYVDVIYSVAFFFPPDWRAQSSCHPGLVPVSSISPLTNRPR